MIFAEEALQGVAVLTMVDLIDAGGPMAFVRKAAEAAARAEAATWVETIADGLAKYEATDNPDPMAVVLMQGWLKQLRRVAGIKPSADEIRAQTRERVRRHRERRRADLP